MIETILKCYCYSHYYTVIYSLYNPWDKMIPQFLRQYIALEKCCIVTEHQNILHFFFFCLCSYEHNAGWHPSLCQNNLSDLCLTSSQALTSVPFG